jgi:hypothetical protein
MSQHPPSPFAGRLPGRRSGTPAAGAPTCAVRRLALVLLAALVAACGVAPPPSGSGPTTAVASRSPAETATPIAPSGASPSVAGSLADGLVIGSGASVERVGADGVVAGIPGPPRALRSLAATPDGLLAVLDDGSVARWTGGGQAWAPIDGISGAAAAASDPDGTRIAVLPADRLGGGRPLALTGRQLGSGEARATTAAGLEANGRPAWLADGRIVLRAIGRAGTNVLAFVDPATSSVTTRPFDGVDLAISGDGATAALLLVDGVRVVPSSALGEAGAGKLVGASGRPAGASPAAAALDRTGARVAIAWVDEGGATVAITVASAAGGWQEAGTVEPPAGGGDVLLAWTP